ncbi:unnamed protein product, partial [Adineta ricciae]
NPAGCDAQYPSLSSSGSDSSFWMIFHSFDFNFILLSDTAIRT